MSVENFQPRIWASAIDVPYQEGLVYAQESVASTQFAEPLLQGGKSIKIQHIGTANIRDHNRNEDLVYDNADLTETELVMDQEKYFGFRVSDVDKAQAAGDFQSPLTAEHAYRLSAAADTYVGAAIKKNAKHKLDAATVFDGSDYMIPAAGQRTAWDILRAISTELNKHAAPSLNRWAVVGPNFAGALLADRRFTDAAAAGTDKILRSGMIGAVPTLGLTVMTSNSVPTTKTAETVAAGAPGAVAYASQIYEIEALRDPNRFGDLVRGLLVFGAQVVRPDGLVTVDVDVKPGSPAGGSPAGGSPAGAAA